MSSDTNVGLGRRTRLHTARWLLSLASLARHHARRSGANPGPFYHVNYYQVRPGDEKAHDSRSSTSDAPFQRDGEAQGDGVITLAQQDCRFWRVHKPDHCEVASPSSEGGFQRNLEAGLRRCSASRGATPPRASMRCAAVAH